MDLNYQYEPAGLLEERLPYGQVFGLPAVQPGEEIASAQDYAVCRRIMRALIFLAGASALMDGNYLTTVNQPVEKDLQMLKDLGLTPEWDEA